MSSQERDEKGRFIKGSTPWSKGRKGFYYHIHPVLEPSKDLAYILGVIFGDGSVFKTGHSHVVKLSVTSPGFANSFAESLRRIGLNPRIDRKEGGYGRDGYYRKPVYTCRGFSAKFVRWFKDGVDLDEHLNNNERKLAFLKGFYESEGYLRMNYGPSKSSCSFVVYNTDLKKIDTVRVLLKQLGYHPKVVNQTPTKSGKPYYSVGLYRRSEIGKLISETGINV